MPHGERVELVPENAAAGVAGGVIDLALRIEVEALHLPQRGLPALLQQRLGAGAGAGGGLQRGGLGGAGASWGSARGGGLHRRSAALGLVWVVALARRGGVRRQPVGCLGTGGVKGLKV